MEQDHFWTQAYPAGIPADITQEMAQYGSVAHLFTQSCQRYDDATAYVNFGVRLSYKQLSQYSHAFAAWLQQRGLRKADRVALMMPNLLQYPVCLFGVLLAGGVVVNVNPLYTANELRHQLSDSGATFIVVAENFAHTVEKAMAGTAVRHVVLTSVGELLGPLRGRFINAVLRHVRKQIPAHGLGTAYTLADILAGRSNHYTPVQLTHNDLAFLQYTGGTTGRSKGAMLSHGNIVANVCQAHAWVRSHLYEGQETVITALPLYHVFALTANCLTFLRLGATNILITNPRDIASLVKTLAHYRWSAFTGVNTLFNALVQNPGFQHLKFDALKITLGGGMAIHASVAQRWQHITGNTITQAYGLTEASPAVTINPIDAGTFNGSVGLPLPSTQVAIIDDQGNGVSLGEAGEIAIKGPQVCTGYWNGAEQNNELFTHNGYLRTGDIGRFDQFGYVHLLDRKKDLIVVSGFNVYPNEVEAVALSHPGIRDAVAVGMPDAHSGEVVTLFVIASDANLTEPQIIAFCREHLARYKVPRRVEFRTELPRSHIGKILRRALRDDA
jgi:long-chain acyl-CoA synthetase